MRSEASGGQCQLEPEIEHTRVSANWERHKSGEREFRSGRWIANTNCASAPEANSQSLF